VLFRSCRATVERIFPWADAGPDPWATLLWCNGRVQLPGRARVGPDWAWWAAPLSEWDGTVPTLR
jgi:hypothetical protein